MNTSSVSPWRYVRLALLLIGVVLVLIPVYVLIVTSFKTSGDASAARAWALPSEWTLENWAEAWETLSPAMGLSLIHI